jgi:hypothetical protein
VGGCGGRGGGSLPLLWLGAETRGATTCGG